MKKNNLTLALSTFFLFFLCFSGISQKAKSQLEWEKKENLRKIAQAERILNETADKKNVSLGQLKALNQQIKARKSLIVSLKLEIGILNTEITELNTVVFSLQSDLKYLKEEYAEQIYTSYKANRGNSKLMFLFSAKNFNQLLQRLKYLEQYSKSRRVQAEQIEVVSKELNHQRSNYEEKLSDQQVLFNQQVRETQKLTNSKKKQSNLVAELNTKEKELKKEVENRKSSNKRLNTLIAKIIEDKAKKSSSASIAEISSNAELTRLFESKKNNLTWPVGSGFISSKFGKQKHPVLKKITIINDGVGIQTDRDSPVRAVFDGYVTMIAPVTGKNNIVMIRHGDYITIYARLKTIHVKKGQKVKVNDIIGEVYTDRDGISELEFQVYKGITKLNPENWLAFK